MIAGIVILVLGLTIAAVVLILAGEKQPQETPKQAEAHRLLVELDILNEYLPVLPAEFKSKLNTYLRGST